MLELVVLFLVGAVLAAIAIPAFAAVCALVVLAGAWFAFVPDGPDLSLDD